MLRTFILIMAVMTTVAAEQHPNHVSWEGEAGLPGSGKHIVYITNDHEYRTEETCAALGRMMAKHYGFKCTYVTGVNESGEIVFGNGKIEGLEVLESADLLVVGLRFQSWSDQEMAHLDAYLSAGKPVIGLRTSTHAFRMKNKESPYFKYDWKYKGEEYPFGFGEQVLGEHWVGHYGKNHQQSNLLNVIEKNADHVVLTGVSGVTHVVTGGYNGEITEEDGATILMNRTVLDGMTPDSPASTAKNIIHPAVWVRHYAPAVGAEPYPNGRVFNTLHGCSEDILDDNFRRILVNAHLWCLQLEDHITADIPTDFVGPYHPVTFGMNAGRRGVKPADLAGFETPIFDPEKPAGKPK